MTLAPEQTVVLPVAIETLGVTKGLIVIEALPVIVVVQPVNAFVATTV